MERGATIAGLASEFLAWESDSAGAGSNVVPAYGSSGDPTECARFEDVERSKKSHR